MTNSGNIGIPQDDGQPDLPINRFYKHYNCRTVQEKVDALCRQLQQFPNKQIPIEQQLSRLETDFYKMIQGPEREAANNGALDKKKWKDAYKMVDDSQSVDAEGKMSVQDMIRGRIQFSRD